MLDDNITPDGELQLSAGQLLQLKLDNLNISQEEFANRIEVARQTVSGAITGRIDISKRLSRRLGKFFNQPEDHWYNLGRERKAIALANEVGTTQSSVMVDAEISAAIDAGDITITNFNEDRLRQASYDFTISEDLLDLNNNAPLQMGEDGFAIKPGQVLNMTTEEEICLRDQYVGCIGTSADLARFGLIVNTGHQADPGFSGSLQFSVYNPLPNDIWISSKSAIISVTIHRLTTKPTRSFDQKWHSQTDTRMAKAEHGIKCELITRLYDFLSKAKWVKKVGEFHECSVPGVRGLKVKERNESDAIEAIASQLAERIYHGWGFAPLEAQENDAYRSEVENINLNRSEILSLLEAFEVKFDAHSQKISSDWIKPPLSMLVCSEDGLMQMDAVIDGIQVCHMFDHIHINM